MSKDAINRALLEKDPAYQMSMPSSDPLNVLGYYQWANVPVEEGGLYQNALEHPLRRSGFNPKYDVYVPPSYDPLNMGERSQMWGATLPPGGNWRSMTEKYQGEGSSEENAAKAMYDYLSEGQMDEDTRSELKYSDQTVYYNQANQSTDRPETVGHESTHRAIWNLAEQVWGPNYLTPKMNGLMTRVMDYKYGNKAARERAIPFIKAWSTSGTLEGGVNEAMPLIEELTRAVK